MSEAHKFNEIFQRRWKDAFSLNKEKYLKAYSDEKVAPWTDLMLPKNSKSDPVKEPMLNKGFLHYVAEEYMQDIDTPLRQEWYTIDLLGLRKPDRNDDYTKGKLHFILEHENKADIETEIWKLVHWRAPLKVLICYAPEGHTSLSDEKINQINEIYKLPFGKDSAEYLILVGSRQNDDIVFEPLEFPNSKTD